MSGLPEIQMQSIFISFKISATIEQKPQPIMSELKVERAIRSNSGGSIVDAITGKQLDYDVTLQFNINPQILRIDEFTAFYLDNYPTSNFNHGDYTIVKPPNINNGVMLLYLSKIKLSTPSIYYIHGVDTLANFQCNFDNQKLIAYTRKDMYIPFDENSIIWKRVPTNTLTTTNQIKLISNKFVHFNLFRELIFEDVNYV